MLGSVVPEEPEEPELEWDLVLEKLERELALEQVSELEQGQNDGERNVEGWIMLTEEEVSAIRKCLDRWPENRGFEWYDGYCNNNLDHG